MPKDAAPRGWPAGVEYVPQQKYAKDLPVILVEHLRGAKATSRPTTCALVQIRRIIAPGHPASGQCGLYAARKISPKAHILDYAGEVHSDEREDSNYDLSLVKLRASDFPGAAAEDQEWISVGVDAARFGNEARFINDYRGVGQAPNATFQERIVDGELRIGVFAGPRGISKNEEILVSYGKGWWAARCEA